MRQINADRPDNKQGKKSPWIKNGPGSGPVGIPIISLKQTCVFALNTKYLKAYSKYDLPRQPNSFYTNLRH